MTLDEALRLTVKGNGTGLGLGAAGPPAQPR
jgi:hypothetical protein